MNIPTRLFVLPVLLLSGDSMKIAITAYVDNKDKEKYADECNLMTYSGQCLDERFTFIIFTHPDAAKLIDKYKNVKVVVYNPPDDKYYSTYRFARSLRFVYDNKNILENYDYIVKTDTDCLFTPKMNLFTFDSNIYIGRANYTNPLHKNKNEKKMKEVAEKFGYPTYEKIFDVHSTIVCLSNKMIELMNLSDKLCKEMYYYLDVPGEWYGENLWRGDYGYNSGICSMYALEIILSTDENKDNVVVTDLIDAGASLENFYNNFYHFHCYHNDFIYSKFQAKFGSYESIEKQEGESSAVYCINKYIERRDLGLKNPEQFSKPKFTYFTLPEDYGGPIVKYSFDKKVDKKSSIFVQISSYHDYELSATILEAMKKSSGKNVINFGVHVIYHENNDIVVPSLKNVKLEVSKAPDNLGMGIGRNIAHSFYSGEDYYVQVDSHTMFDQDWDEIFISDIERYKRMGFEKPLLTSYPRNYWYENGVRKYDIGGEDHVTYISFHENKDSFRNTRVVSQTALANDPTTNIFSKSVSGGAIFTVGDFIEPNTKIFANGEEIFIAARAWTRGYDLLLPSRHVIYHLYYNHADKGNNSHHEVKEDGYVLSDTPNNRRLAWVDYNELCNNLDAISKKEIYDMFTQNIVGRYHLGDKRTLDEFGFYAGLDFKTGEIIDNCG